MGDLLGLTVTIEPADDSDEVEVADLTAALRRRLLELDVERVEPVRLTEVPADAKPVDAVALGALLVSLAPPVLTAVVGMVETWLANRPVRSVKVVLDGDVLELAGSSRADQRRLVDAFLRRHGD